MSEHSDHFTRHYLKALEMLAEEQQRRREATVGDFREEISESVRAGDQRLRLAVETGMPVILLASPRTWETHLRRVFRARPENTRIITNATQLRGFSRGDVHVFCDGGNFSGDRVVQAALSMGFNVIPLYG